MKVRYIINPKIPDTVSEKSYLVYSNVKSCHDWRSIASERYAFDYMGINELLYEEEHLIKLYSRKYGIKIPECIAKDPQDPGKIISVEVKRICGNHLPCDYQGQERRILRFRDKIVWPWSETVKNSLLKAHPYIINDMNVSTHHNVFIIPSSLTQRNKKRVCRQIQSSVESFYDIMPPCNHVIHVIEGGDKLFDRLLY